MEPNPISSAPAQPVPPAQPVQPVPPVQPAQTVTPAEPVKPAEPAVKPAEPAKPVKLEEPVAEPAGPSVVEPKKPKKKSHAMALVVILFILIAAAGVGFGVFMMMEKDNQATSYNKQIASLKSQIAELEEGTTNVVIDNEEIIETVVDTKDYIYVGEWGLKIKIPEDLKTVSYSFAYGNDYTAIYATGVSSGGQYFPEFANIEKNTDGLGTITRRPKSWQAPQASAPTLVFSDDNYNYYASRSQAAYSTVEDEKEWESSSTKLIYEMFSNSENYSKI